MKEKKEKKKLIAILIGVFTSISLYLIFGAVTSIVKNQFFTRMTPVGWFEHASLITTSLLLGIYIGLVYYGKPTKKGKICNASATAGGIFGFLTFGCPICNKIFVFFLGVAGVLTYFEPIRPFLGVFSILFLVFPIIQKYISIQAA